MYDNNLNIMKVLREGTEQKTVTIKNRTKLYFKDGSICTVFTDDATGKNMRIFGLNDKGKKLVRNANFDARLAPSDSYPITRSDIENWIHDGEVSLNGVFDK